MDGFGWTAEKDAILTRLYPEQGARACQALLPQHSIAAICQRARKIGLVRQGGYQASNGSEWTPADDDVLRRNYALGWKACAEALPNRSRLAIKLRAGKLALATAKPEESAAPIPAHDYTDADRALAQWRGPVLGLGTFVPALGMQVAA